jgi:hypothetical protein
MRKFLSILLFYPAICFSQEKDSVVMRWVGSGNKPATGISYPIATAQSPCYMLSGSIKPAQDTFAVIMLVCDTAAMYHLLVAKEYIDDYGDVHDTVVHADYRRYVWWQLGYEVRRVERRNNTEGKIDPGFDFGFKYEEWNVYFHEAYLDKNKKPLPKSIVVWMTKKISQ